MTFEGFAVETARLDAEPVPRQKDRYEKKTRVEQRGEYETEMKMRLKDALKATGRG